jgi:RHS repeat-associated protein
MLNSQARKGTPRLDRQELKCTGGSTDEQCSGGRRSDRAFIGTTEAVDGEQTSNTDTGHTKTQSYDYDSALERLGYQSTDSSPAVPDDYRSYDKDANGSVIGLERDDGSIAPDERYHFDPYGDLDRPGHQTESELSPQAQDNPFRFEGFYYDSGVKSYDMHARVYRPEVGRFLTEDRLEQASANLNLQSDPLTQARYAFAGGNPVNDVEFDGHCGILCDVHDESIFDCPEVQGKMAMGPHTASKGVMCGGGGDGGQKPSKPVHRILIAIVRLILRHSIAWLKHHQLILKIEPPHHKFGKYWRAHIRIGYRKVGHHAHFLPQIPFGKKHKHKTNKGLKAECKIGGGEPSRCWARINR